MKVRIKSIPKGNQDIRINPFSSPYPVQENSPSMKYGGPLTGNPSQIDTNWNWMNGGDNGIRKNPYEVSRTLPEAKGVPDAVIEKKEQVMGDFGGDGMPTLKGANAGTHASGNDLPVNLPDNSFVFSDTKGLQIKDKNLLSQFGAASSSTPAKLAKKYDLSKYKGIIDNPDADDMDKKTAQMNYTNAIGKLNDLASVQENMKSRKGLPNDLPQQQSPGGMFQTGGNYRFDQNADPSTLSYQQWQMQNKPNSVAMATNEWFPGMPSSGRYDDGIYGFRTKMVQGLDENAIPSPYSNSNGSREDIQPLGLAPLNAIDTPTSSYIMSNPYDTSIGDSSNSGKKRGTTNFGYGEGNPDFYRDAAWALRASSYPDYHPIRQTAHGAIPQFVPEDYRAQLAAIQSGNNKAAELAALSGNGPISRASAMDIAAKSAPESGQIVAGVQNRNAQGMSRINEIAANTYNTVNQLQQGYNKDYAEATNNAQKDRFGFDTAMQNEFVKSRYLDQDKARKNAYTNMTNPDFYVDSQGFAHRNIPAQKAYIERSLGMNPSGGGSGIDQQLELAQSLREKYLKKGFSSEMAEKQALEHAGLYQHSSESYDKNNPYKAKERVSGIYQQMGGRVKVRISDIPK